MWKIFRAERLKMTGESDKVHCFKAENKFIVKSGCKKRMWRSLKQILAAERALPWPNEAVLCKLHKVTIKCFKYNLPIKYTY